MALSSQKQPAPFQSVAAAIFALVACIETSCTPRKPFDPTLQGREFFLCCNLRFNENRDATDANYAYPTGTTLPLGTPVRVVEVTGISIRMQTHAQPKPYNLELRYGVKYISPQQYFGNLLLEADPTPRLAQFPHEVEVAIREGKLLQAMTKEQAIMARGYPPSHRTARIGADEWVYFQNRGFVDRVRFVAGKIATIETLGAVDEVGSTAVAQPTGAQQRIDEVEKLRAQADRLIILAGGLQPNRRYTVLGSVAAQEVGAERPMSVEHPRGSSFKRVMLTPLSDPLRYAEKPEMEDVTYDDAHMDVLLKNQAIVQYGNDVDAIINATYSRLPNGTVTAKGLAIHFTGPEEEDRQPPLGGEDAESRLRKLEALRSKGLINEQEYERKRQEILDDL